MCGSVWEARIVDKKVWLTSVACYNTMAVLFLASGGALHTSSCDIYYCDVLKFLSFGIFVKGRVVWLGFF